MVDRSLVRKRGLWEPRELFPPPLESPLLRLLSFSGGVQSTTLALLSAAGKLPMLDGAIFADTGGEMAQTHRTVRAVAERVPFPVHTVMHWSGSLAEHLIEGEGGLSPVDIPAFTSEPNGILRRFCTGNYKRDVVSREIRRLLGKRHGPVNGQVELWIGISTDEAQRAKQDTRARFRVRRFPLIQDLGWSRSDCEEWLAAEHPDMIVRRSSCTFCPFHLEGDWNRVRNSGDASDWEQAVAVDEAIRDRVPVGQAFLSTTRTPLVELPVSTGGRETTMGDECEGMCGL